MTPGDTTDPARPRSAWLRLGGSAAQVAASQFAVAGSNYLLLALAARRLDAAGLAVVTSYYLLINTVGRGLFAAVELETTRAVAHAVATGADDGGARRAATRQTGVLLAGAAVLIVACTPLLAPILGSAAVALGTLGVGALAMAASYLLRGPLAGHQRYGRYAATFWVEAGAGLVAGVTLAVVGVTQPLAWIAVLALSPLVAAVVLARPSRVPSTGTAPGDGSLRAVLWSAALLMAGQGVWNIAPVLVTSRLADSGPAAAAVAAGFVTAAVLLRAPVLFFPSVQALLLPRFTALAGSGGQARLRATIRTLGLLIVVGGAVWVAVAVFVVPPVAHLVFGATVTPPAWVLALLALSTVFGAAAQIGQTYLVAVRRPAVAAIAWIAGLAVLVAIGLLAAPPLTAGTLGQLAGAVVVFVLLSLHRRPVTRPS